MVQRAGGGGFVGFDLGPRLTEGDDDLPFAHERRRHETGVAGVHDDEIAGRHDLGDRRGDAAMGDVPADRCGVEVFAVDRRTLQLHHQPRDRAAGNAQTNLADLDGLEVAADLLARAKDRRETKDGRAVGGVVVDGDLQLFGKSLRDAWATRCRHRLDQDRRVRRPQSNQGFNEAVFVGGVDAQGQPRQTSERREKSALGFNDRQRRTRRDAVEPEHAGAIGDDGDALRSRCVSRSTRETIRTLPPVWAATAVSMISTTSEPSSVATASSAFSRCSSFSSSR